MKRFFPLLLGLTLICLSFSTNNTKNPLEVDESAVNIPIKICDFNIHYAANQYNCNLGSAQMEVKSDCTADITIFLRVVNLDENPIKNKSYTLPGYVDDMYYHLTHNGTTHVVGPINSFVYMDDHAGQPIYTFSSIINLDIANDCQKDQATYINFDVSIKDVMNNDYDLIPHSDIEGVFSCTVFEETCNSCFPPPSGCLSGGGDLNYYNLTGCGEPCPVYCLPSNLTQTSEIDAIELNTQNQQSEILDANEVEVQNLDLTVTPNPFTDRLEIKFNTRIKSNFSVELIDSNGKIISTTPFRASSRSATIMDVSNVPSGLYYCKIIVQNKIYSKKLIKL